MLIPIDPAQMLNWVGGGLIAVLIWAALGIFKRLDRLETLLVSETSQLRELYHDVDKRVQLLETVLPRARPMRASDPAP